MVKKSDGGEYHDVLNGKNSQLQKTREKKQLTVKGARSKSPHT